VRIYGEGNTRVQLTRSLEKNVKNCINKPRSVSAGVYLQNSQRGTTGPVRLRGLPSSITLRQLVMLLEQITTNPRAVHIRVVDICAAPNFRRLGWPLKARKISSNTESFTMKGETYCMWQLDVKVQA
jgi:hypothetical protein